MKNQAKFRAGMKLYGHTPKNAGGKYGRSKQLRFWRKASVETWEYWANKIYAGAK